VRAFSILAGVALAIAAIFFIVWSVDHVTISPTVRFAILTTVGASLVVGSELRVAQGYAITARSLAAGGVATLFATFYAGYALWGFYGAGAGFALLVLPTVVAVLLAIRRSSLVIAVLGLLGGFSTPILVSSGEDRPLSLFGYLLLLNAALAWVSYKRRWTLLPWLSLGFTAIYQAGWVGMFLDDTRIPLALGLFLVLAAAGYAAIRLGGGASPRAAARARWAAAAIVPPALLALYLAASPSFDVPWPLLFGFLAILAAGLATVAAWHGPEWLHVGGAGMVLVVSAASIARSDGASAALLASAFAVMLGACVGLPFLLARLGRGFRAEGRLAILAAPLLALYVSFSPSPAERWPLLVGFVALVGAGLAAAALRERREWLHAAGAATALASIVAVLAHLPGAGERPLVAAGLVFLVVYVGLPLLLARDSKSGRGFHAEGRLAVLAAPAFAIYAALSPAFAGSGPLLFGFLALVAIGLALAAAWQKPEWLHLAGGAAALVCAAALVGGRADGWPLRATLLLLLAVYVGAPLLLARLGRGFAGGARLAALAAPLFALYASAHPSLAGTWPLLLGFLALAAAGLAAAAAWQGPEWLHPAGAALTLAALATHLATSFTPGDWPLLAAFVALLAVPYLAAPLVLARLGRDFRAEGRQAVLAAPLLLAAYLRAAPVDTAAPALHFLAPLLGMAALLSLWAVVRSDARVHVLSSALTLGAAAVWSAVHLQAANLYPALLAYLALGGLLLAAPLLAERRGRPLAGAMTSPLLLVALVLLAFLARPLAGAAMSGLAGLTILAALFQAALFFEAGRGRHPLLAAAGVLIGFIELALWAATGLAQALLPGLVAVAILSVVALGGAVLAGSREGAPREGEPGPAPVLRNAPLLALAGHLFLAVVAAQPALALPPAPWLAVLGVLDLAFVAAALLRRRTDLGLAAAAATIVVFFSHHVGMTVAGGPLATVMMGAALGAGALFLGGHLLARRLGAAPAAGLGRSGFAPVVALHGAQLLLLLYQGDVPIAFAVAAHLALLAGLLALAWITGAEALALSSAVGAGLAALVPYVVSAGDPMLAIPPSHALAVATSVYLAALVYPLLRGRRGRAEWFPFVAAVVASGVHLVAGRSALLALGAGPYIGALPVVQAALLVPHLRALLRMERASRPSGHDLRRLALVAAAILALVTVAIPLQLEKQWWTIGWAVLAAALGWLWRRVPHRGLLVWAAALLAASFIRLVPFFNLWMFDYEPPSGTPIWNWYLYTYLAVAAAHFAAARWFSRGDDRAWAWAGARGPRLSTLAAAAGAVLLFFLLNVEIADYWSRGARLVFRFSAGVAPDLSYTIGWAVFALGLLTAGVALRSRGTRLAAIVLLVVTVLKGFLHDLGHLTGLYRVGSLVGLAVSLALVAIVLQRFVLRRADAPLPHAPGPTDGDADASAGPEPTP
jgi:hypothetical protein